MRLQWSKIAAGKPVAGGRIVNSVGMVLLTEQDEDNAAEIGGNPWVELADKTASDSDMKQWVVQQLVPSR